MTNRRTQYESWLSAHGNITGILACGICFEDKTSIVRSWAEPWPTTAIEMALRAFSDSFEVARLHSLQATEQVWQFDRARVHCARRQDGVMLALFVRQEAAIAGEWTRLRTAFLGFSPAD